MIYPENFDAKIGFDRVVSQVAALCSTRGAVEKLSGQDFSADYAEVSGRLALSDEMRTVLMMEGDFPDEGYVDMDGFLSKVDISGMFLETEEIVILRRGLAMVKDLTAFFNSRTEGQYPALREFSSGTRGFADIINHIDSIIDKFGKVRDNASPELYTLRRRIRENEGLMSKRLHQILGAAQASGLVDPDAQISLRDGRAVIPVPVGNKRKISGFVHDESATGKTVYIEPVEVVELNNELREMEYEQRREVVRILTRFTDMIRPEMPDIKASADYLTSVDMIRAKARYAIQNGCVKPIVIPGAQVSLRQARHPLLAQTLAKEGRPIVPLDIALDTNHHILVISGPNAGGKSVCLKTVGLLQYMLQKGFLVPASENSEMGIFKDIFIDIGDEQSIDNDLSTYSSHLLNMKHIVRGADNRSLVLIDEFGSGTEPVIGGAIAEAILQRLEERGCFAVITTHYSNLKYYASNAKGIINGAMTFDVQNIRPLFKLEVGRPGSSFAVEIARSIGLPEDIIRAAAEKAGSDHINIERQLREIARDKRYWEEKRDKIRVSERRTDELAEKYEAELSELRAERKKILREAKSEAENIVSEANRRIENTIREIKESQADKERTVIARKKVEAFKSEIKDDSHDDEAIDRKIQSLREREQRRLERRRQRDGAAPAGKPTPETPKPKEIAAGVRVRIKDQNAVGEVVEIRGGKAMVAIGQIMTTIAKDRLEAISNAEYKKGAGGSAPARINVSQGYDVMQKRLNFSHKIDLRGMRVDEALDKVTEFVDQAIMLGIGELSILHGKGTGALKEEIRRYLRTVELVDSVADEREEQGGAGITVVRLDV